MKNGVHQFEKGLSYYPQQIWANWWTIQALVIFKNMYCMLNNQMNEMKRVQASIDGIYGRRKKTLTIFCTGILISYRETCVGS